MPVPGRTLFSGTVEGISPGHRDPGKRKHGAAAGVSSAEVPERHDRIPGNLRAKADI